MLSDKEIAVNAAKKLQLPDESKSKLIDLVNDPPPRKKYHHIHDALSAKAISSGVSDENMVTKAVRVGLWALLYFPTDFIAWHHLLSWGSAKKHTEDSPDIRGITKDMPKIRKCVDGMGIPVVGITTQLKTSDPSTVHGYRLTTCGNDYVVRVLDKNVKRVGNAMRQHIRDLRPERVKPEYVTNPALRKELERELSAYDDMVSDKLLDQFISPPRLCLPEIPAKKR